MRLPALRLAFLRSGAVTSAMTAALGDLLLGTVLLLPADLPEAEREEICDLLALFLDNLPVHIAARSGDLPEGHLCVLTEPVEQAIAPVKDSVVIAGQAIEAGRRRLGLSQPLRRLRDVVLHAIGQSAPDARLREIAGWAQAVADSPSTALRFVSAAYRESLGRPGATDAELVIEGLAETIAWLLHGVDPRVAEWVLARAVPSRNPGRLVSLEAALLGETAALQRALAAGLVEHLPSRPDDPDDVLDLRRPIALLGQLGDLAAPVELSALARALRPRLDPLAHRVFDRALRGRPKPLRQEPPIPPSVLLGRDDVLARLTTLFEPTREIRTAVVQGLGGIGKSAVASTLCESLADRLEPVWLTFASGPEAAWQRVADALGVDTQPRRDEPTKAGKPAWVRRVHQAMAERDALLIVDDVDGMPESELPAWLPAGAGTCSVLVLSRQSQRVLEREHDAIAVSLPALRDEEARVLLARKAPTQAEAIRRGEADVLLRQLDGHPMAIGLAGGLLEKQSIAEVAGLLQRGVPAVQEIARPALAALDAEERAVVEALAVAARSGSPHALGARMVGVESVERVLRRLADQGVIELGPRTVRLHGIVQLAVEGAMSEAHRRSLEVAHAQAADAVMKAARKARNHEGQDEVVADAMLALGRMTGRCRAGEGELVELLKNVAFELARYPRGPRGETLSAVIAGQRAVLRVWTRESHPESWAEVQNLLADALIDLPVGDRAENLRQAIDALEAALTFYTRDRDPKGWATAQNYLGAAFLFLPTGKRRENVRRAVEAFEASLTITTEHGDPEVWAASQNNLGNALGDLPDGDKAENQRRAIEAYQAALRVYTRQAHPEDWANVQNNLGCALSERAKGNRAKNLRRAIDAFQAALTVHTRQAYPEYWARAQGNLGSALATLPDGGQGDTLRRAIEAYQEALTVCTRDAFPWDWAHHQYNLGLARVKISTGDRRQNLKAAVSAFRAALTVYTEEAFPDDHATTQADLDLALRELAALGPATDPPPRPAAD